MKKIKRGDNFIDWMINFIIPVGNGVCSVGTKKKKKSNNQQEIRDTADTQSKLRLIALCE